MADDDFDPAAFAAAKPAAAPPPPSDDEFDPNAFAAHKAVAGLKPIDPLPALSIPEMQAEMSKSGQREVGRGIEQIAGQPLGNDVANPDPSLLSGSRVWDVARGAGNVALGAADYLGSWPNAIVHGIVGAPVAQAVTRGTGSETAGDIAGAVSDIGATIYAPIPKELPRLRRVPEPVAPPAEPFGVTLSEGQETGNLPTIKREQAALRNQAGDPAYQRAQQFAEQQRAQVEAAKDVATSRLNPTGDILAATPQDTGDIVSAELRNREVARSQAAQDEGEALRPKNLTHPQDAADTVATALRGSSEAVATSQQSNAAALAADREAIRTSLSPTGQVIARNPQEAADVISAGVTRAEEQATAVRDAAYDKFRNMPGSFRPQAFTNIGNDVRRTFNDPKDPFIMNDKTTPNTVSAIDDLDKVLGEPARVAADPDTKSFAPFTPSTIDDVRKRLNAYWRAANNTARATNDYSDVAGMSRVVDAFDDVVSQALKRKRLFDGDGRQIGQAWDDALAAHADLRKTFSPQGKGDTVGPVMNKIVGQREGQAAPANQIDQWTTGSGATPVLVGRRLQSIFGPNSPEIGAIKQSLWSKAVEPPEGMSALPPEKIADNIDKLRASELARTHFTPDELGRMRQHAIDLRNSVPAPAAKTDVVGSAIGKINGVGGQPWTPAELSGTLFGKSGTGDNPLGVKLAQHVKTTYGEDSDAFRALQSGQISSLTRATEGRAGFDPQAISSDIKEFLDGRGRPMAETLYTPEQQATLRTYADKLDDYAKRTAPPGKTDPVEQAIARITGRDGKPPATAREVTSMLLNRSSAADRMQAVNLAKRLKETLSPEQFAAVKQGLFRQIIEPGPKENAADWGSPRIVKRISDLFNNAPELTKAVFDPEDIKMIREYQRLHQKLTVPQAGAQWSNNAPLINRVGKSVAYLIGATLGHYAGMGMPLVGEAAGLAAVRGLDKMGQQREARRIATLMPMVGERMQRYQQAVDAAQRTRLPQYETRMALAGTQLTNALKPLGIDFNRLAVQGPGVAGAQDQNQQQVPRVPSQQKNGGGVDGVQPRAHGGKVGRDLLKDAKPKEHPVVKGARLAPDGSYYLNDPNRPGRYLKVIERNGRRSAA